MAAATLCLGTLIAAAANGQTAQWIWGSAQANQKAESGRCEFRKTFTLGDARSATLRIACDDHYVLRLNGRLVGLGNRWQQADAYDITPLLRTGQNQVLVRCRNEGDAAGLMVQIDVTLTDGSSRRILSDAGWEARTQTSGTWDPSRSQFSPWAAAFEIGAFGTVSPWSDQVAAATEVKAVRAASPLDGAPFRLRDDDRVVFLGGTLVERAQRYGYLEAALTSAFPDTRLRFRNLGWSGDTVFGVSRARFGTVAEGFEHLETHVFAEQPTVIFVAYGTNESFGGLERLDEFTTGMNDLLDVLSATGAHLVLMTPIPFENLGPPLPDVAIQNENLRIYRDRILQIAEQRHCRVVDWFERLPQIVDEYGVQQSLTDNGMHLHDRGYWFASQALLAELGLPRQQVQLSVNVTSGQHQMSGAELQRVSIGADQVRLEVRPDLVTIPPPDAAATIDSELAGWQVAVEGLPPGNYELRIDGRPVATGRAEQWEAGMTLRHSPQAKQADQLLRLICQKNELYFHRWRPQNETYLFLFRKHEQGNNAVEIPQFDPLVESTEHSIRSHSVPRRHDLQWVRQP